MLLFILLYVVVVVQLGAQGYYLEFKVSNTSQEANAVTGSMKLYAQNGNSRSSINMTSAALPGGDITMTTLSLKSAPDTVFMLDEKAKTYTALSSVTKDEWKERALADYKVEVLGKEKVNGYNTTHVRVLINDRLHEELWTTKDIEGYADFSKIKSKYTGQDNLYKALTAKGAEGMPVRIRVNESYSRMQMDLVKAEKRTNPSSLFTLEGYNRGSGLSGFPVGPELMQDVIRKMQDATPEEREELIRQMNQMVKPH